MIVETTQLIDRWLHHDTYGVAALLPEIPRKNFENDDYPMPDVPDIVNDTEDASVVTAIEPVKSPSLVIYCETGPITNPDERLIQRSSNLVIVVAYITKDMPPLRAVIESGLCLRAVRRSMTHFNSLEKSQQYRTLNGIKIARIAKVRYRQTRGAVGKSRLWGFVYATVELLDSDP